jgi:hypothetical protein
MHRQKDKSISRKGDGDTDRERERERKREKEREEVRHSEREGQGGERERERERAGEREINTQIDGHPCTTRSTSTRTYGRDSRAHEQRPPEQCSESIYNYICHNI